MTPHDTCPVCRSRATNEINRGIRDWEYGVEGVWSHLECEQCGLVRLHPFPSLDDLKRAYEIDYHGYVHSTGKGAVYSLLYALNDRMMQRKFAPYVPAGARILDIGCGSGEFLMKFAKLGAASLEGIDFSSQAAEQSAARGIKTFQGVFMDFPAAPASYDVVIMNNYLEHTLEPSAELRKALGILKPGGFLIGEIPNYRSLDRMAFGPYWGGNHAPRHTYHFSPEALQNLLRKIGFANVAIQQQINPAHMALSIQNLLQKNSEDLRNNPSLTNGRAKYYPLLLLLTAPFNIVAALLGYSGLMQFQAQRI